MFASWKKARGASLIAAAAALSCALSPPARALEGIQGRHAIFYPSLELVYQHDDNYFLEHEDEHTADTFIAHAHFAVEVPGARQHVRFEYAPQWRSVDISKNDPSERFTDYDADAHFWELDADLKGSSVFGVDIHHDYSTGTLEGYIVDPNVAEMIRDQRNNDFWRNNIDIDFKWEGSRQGARIMLGKEDFQFDDPAKAPSWFDLNAWNLGAEYSYKFAPLSHFIAGYQYTHNTQDYTQLVDALANPLSADSIENELWLGVRGELGRTTTGSAQAGFHSLNYDDELGGAADYDGFTVRADVTKSFSRWTKLIMNAERTPNFSAYSDGSGGVAANTYYVSNRLSFTLTNQPQGSRVFWTLIGQFQRNDWPVEVISDKEREDDVLRLRAEVGFHPIEHLSFRLNYEHKDADSNFRDPTDGSQDYDWTDNLIILQVQFGF